MFFANEKLLGKAISEVSIVITRKEITSLRLTDLPKVGKLFFSQSFIFKNFQPAET